MTTMEKLLVEIFNRKNRIIEQMQQQADSYTQQLASRLLIDGITPPPWLLSPNSNSRSSDPNELLKEEIISKLLLRPPRDSTRYSTGGHSLYCRPVVAGGNINKPLSTEMCMETHAPNKDINISNEPILILECQNNDIAGSLDHVPELDDSAKSPQNETDARITSIYAASDMSLARIQRSKSRQKARELRTNGKTTAKSCSSSENRIRISCSGDSKSEKDIHQVIQNKRPSDMSKWNNVSGATSMAEEGNGEKVNDGTSHSHRLAKSSSSCDIPSLENGHNKTGPFSDNGELDGGVMVEPTGDSLQQSCHANDVMEPSNLSDACFGRYAGKKLISGKTQGTQSQNNLFYGRITRSRSSRQQTSGIKGELDGGITVEPTGESLQKSCHVNGVMEGFNLPDACLGSYARKKLITGTTHGTQSQNNLFCGRITRSRSSSQQTSGINNSSKLGKPVSCNLKGGGALSHSAGDLMHELNISNKFSDAVETSQVLSDINAETQAICSNEGVLKPAISSYIDMKKSPLSANHHEKAEIVVGNGPLDEPVVIQPVNSGAKLDPVTLCMQPEGLALRQSSDCCMNVKPKQLNFDENECDANEIFSSLSKKRKLDKLSGKECFPSKESASSADHKSRSTDQQLPKANIVSHSPENGRAHSYNKIDEIEKDGMKDIGLDMNENPVVEDVEHNSMFSQHDDIDVTCEVNLSPKEVDNKFDEEMHSKFDEEMHSEKSHLNEDQASSLNMQTNEDDSGQKGKESAAGVHIHVSNIKSSFTTSLTKQGNSGFKDCLDKEDSTPEVDLDSSKSKEFEVKTIAKLPNLKLNSAKVNTWPLNQQKNFEDQPNCFSDSRNFSIHFQRDAIHCDLETLENDSNLLKESASILSSKTLRVTQSDGMQSCDKSVHDEMICDLPEGIESLLEIQAAEEMVTEVDDDAITEITDPHEQSEPTCVLNLIKNAADDMGPENLIINGDVAVADNSIFEINLPEWVSSYGSVQFSQNDDKTMVGSDKITPVYEGSIIHEEIGNVKLGNTESGIDFDTLEIPSTTIARASIIEQICKSASMQTPLSEFSTTFQQHQVQGLYGFMADGILDQMDIGTTVSVDEDSGKHLQTSDTGITKIGSVSTQHQKFDYATPFDWQSKYHYSSPVGKLWERSASSSASSEIQLSSNPDLTCFPIEEDPSSNEENENPEEMHDEHQENTSPDVENENPVRVSSEMEVERRKNDDEVAVEITEVCAKHGNHVSKSSMKYQDSYSSNSVSIEVSVPRTHNKVKHKPKIHHGIKVSRYEENRDSSIATRASSRGIPRLSQKDAKRNNIVSNITSFIPIVQQKQAAAVCTGKRDIKVKALEAAEAARRREQEKENERKLKKEALKLERARIGKENAKERVLNLKKQEDLKKKEADMAAKKRQREEEERKQLAKKRKLVAETQKNQKLKYEKSHVGKLQSAKEVKNAGMAGNKKKFENLRRNINADENSFKKQDTELRIDKTLANVVQQVTSVPESHDASNDCGEKDKLTSVQEMSPVNVIPVELTSQENSYDISPYQCSDDEDDDEEDDLPTKKFIPSWASINRVAMVLPLQLKLDPESIFSVDSFCNMDEVLLPLRLQAK